MCGQSLWYLKILTEFSSADNIVLKDTVFTENTDEICTFRLADMTAAFQHVPEFSSLKYFEVLQDFFLVQLFSSTTSQSTHYLSAAKLVYDI